MHPSSGEYGLSLFDEVIYSYFIFDNQEQEGNENRIQGAMRQAVDHPQYISDYNITSAIATTTKNNHNNLSKNKPLTNMPSLNT